MKEYERTNSTVINAILMPIMTKYMDGLLSRLKTEDYKCEPLIIHSGGGVMTVDATRLLPARTCISGPAAGVMGGLLYGKAAGFENVITLDMGGTSTDVSLCPKGEMGIVSEWHLAYDVPVLIPAVDLLSIGAGGGSIAWVDETGRLRSGPRSAGAYPGPICYDTGGGEPTTTDAQLVLQRINPRNFCGGELAVKEELSYQGIKEKIAEPLGMKSVEEAAEGIVRIAVGNMVNAVRIVSVERGYDPTDFSMVAFGGGGASCAVEIARDAMIPKVVIPPIASVVGAWGALVAQLRHDFVRSFSKIAGETNTEEINRAFDELDRMAIEALRKDDVADDNITLEHYADLKYYDQSVALTLDMPQKVTDIEKEIVSAYVTRQEREFGYSMPADYTQVELVNLRVSGWGKIPLAKIAEVITETGTAEEAQIGSRDVFFDRGFMKTRIYDRPKLKLEAEVEGPAILEEATTTTVIPPGATAVTDKYGNIIITV
jgi:N-methylhydantoinase A